MKSIANSLVLERGILTSAYKEEIKQSLCSMKGQSLFRVKAKLRKSSARLYSETGTILKVAMFVVALILIFF